MHRKLTGDFFYLQIKTLEGHEEHVTACPLGFYVNNSSNSCFNTNNNAGIHFYNLFDLLKHLSPKFK
jgi:protein TIF31